MGDLDISTSVLFVVCYIYQFFVPLFRNNFQHAHLSDINCQPTLPTYIQIPVPYIAYCVPIMPSSEGHLQLELFVIPQSILKNQTMWDL